MKIDDFTLEASWRIYLDDTAPNIEGRRPTYCTWSATLYDFHDPGKWKAEVALWDGGAHLSHIVSFDGDSVPDWVPTPPDGWDLGVRIEAERRSIDAEAVSA